MSLVEDFIDTIRLKAQDSTTIERGDPRINETRQWYQSVVLSGNDLLPAALSLLPKLDFLADWTHDPAVWSVLTEPLLNPVIVYKCVYKLCTTVFMIRMHNLDFSTVASPAIGAPFRGLTLTLSKGPSLAKIWRLIL